MSGGVPTPADVFCGCLEHTVRLCRDVDRQVAWLLQLPEKPEQHVVPGEHVRVGGGMCEYVRVWGCEGVSM